MSISISQATPIDGADLHNVRQGAYDNSILHRLFLPPDMTPSQSRQYQQYQMTMMQNRIVIQGRFYFKAVDEASGKVVGFVCWVAPTGRPDEHSGTKSDPQMPEMPSFVQKEAIDAIGEKFNAAKANILGERSDYWFLQSMCVLPEFQGRGIADKLMKQGLHDLVDRDGLDCYLEASPLGAGIYQRNGFEPGISIPLMDDGSYTVTTMLRKGRSGGG